MEDRDNSSRVQERRAAEASAGRSARRQAEAAAAAAIIEDAWMVSKDGRKGRVERAGSAAGRQLFQLRDQFGSLGSKRYGALDLRRETLDLMHEQRLAAPVAALALSAARIWWRDTDDDSAGSFWSGVLHPSRQTPGVAGTFLLRYDGENLEEFEDAGEEELVIFVQPNGEYLAHRADDGEQILRDEIELDEGAIARAVAAIFSAPSNAGASPDVMSPAEERASAVAATAEVTQMATAGASMAAAPTAEAVMPEAAASQPAAQAVAVECAVVECAVVAGSELICLPSAGLAALDQAALEQRVSLLRESLREALCEVRVRSRGEDKAAEELLSSLPSADELLAKEVEERGDDENGEDEDDERDGGDAGYSGGINGPTPESWRWYVLRALLDRRESMERDAIVACVLDNCTTYNTKNPRHAVTTVLGKEVKHQVKPLWTSDGRRGSTTRYSLTAEGESLRGTGGFEDLEDVDDEAPPPPAPTIGSLRADCFAAICAGCTSRLAAVDYAWEHGAASTRGDDNRALHRADVVTVLGKEKAKERPLWLYSPDGDLSLTSDGQQLSSDASARAAPTTGAAAAGTAAAAYLRTVASSHNGGSSGSGSGSGGVGGGACGISSSGIDSPASELPPAEPALPPVPMTDPLPEGASPLTVGYTGRVSVEWPHHKLRYPGTVTGWKIALSRKNTPEHTYCVSYDDSQKCEHVLDDTRRRAWQLRAVNEEVEDGWRQLDLTCVISKRRLETPARGEQCRHPALCNEAELRAYVGREKQCPIASCCARLERTAAIVRDTELQAQLAHLPPSAERFWYGPAGEVSAAGPSDIQAKRKRVKVEV